MYLLYIDESGTPHGPTGKHFVLAGAAVHEQTVFFLGRALDQVQEKYFPNSPPVLFHATDIRGAVGSGATFHRRRESASLRILRPQFAMPTTTGCFCLRA